VTQAIDCPTCGELITYILAGDNYCCGRCGVLWSKRDGSTFAESYDAIRAAGGAAWDNLDVEQELAAMRGQPQGIEALVCDDITERQALGINKYGKTVAENPLCLLEWLEHAYQECLDQAVYLRRAMREIDKIMAAKASDEATELGKTIVPQIDPAILPYIVDMQDRFKTSDDETETK